MRLLKLSQTQLISGGFRRETVYVTQAWKDAEAEKEAQSGAWGGGILGGFLGASIGGPVLNSGVWMLVGTCIGGYYGAQAGHWVGYNASVSKNADLKNNSFYIFTYH